MFDLKTATMPEPQAYKAFIQQVKQEARQESETNLVMRLLNRRCGKISEDLEVKVKSLSIPELESLGEALLDFTGMSDLENWLKEHQ